MTKKRSSFNKSWIIIPVLSILVILGFLFIFTNPSFWFKKSIHDDAIKYADKHCLVFYPNSKTSKKMAKKIVSENDKDFIVYDYSLVPYGDYYLVNYGNGYAYFLDKNYQDIIINEISDDGKRIISDYLRYWVKKELPDTYYSETFLNDSYIENLSFEGVSYNLEGENLLCRFPNYDVDVLVPIKYIQKALNMNFGYPETTYSKPIYIDANHPVICITFDDGPQFSYEYNESSSVSIVDTLYRYDANATFYCIGDRLTNREVWTDYQVYQFLLESIGNGNEYGSHSQTHMYLLTEYATSEGIDNAINGPAKFLSQTLDYSMKTYRPPYGVFDDNVLEVQDYPAILWCVDSDDWLNDDAQMAYDKIMNIDLEDGDILLFHDIYDSTAEAMKKIIPALINQGYQLVSVSEMLKHEGIDINTLKYYYNLNPSPYYE